VIHAVLLADLVCDNHRPEAGQGQSEPALRIAGAAYKARSPVAAPYDQLRVAFLAGAHDLVCAKAILERLTYALLIGGQLIEDGGEHDPGLLYDLVLLDLLL